VGETFWETGVFHAQAKYKPSTSITEMQLERYSCDTFRLSSEGLWDRGCKGGRSAPARRATVDVEFAATFKLRSD